MLCKITVIGNVGREPEMRYTPNGAAVTEFSIATSRRYTTAGGERREETEWFRVRAFGRLGEQVSQYVAKGSKLYVEGRLSSSPWVGNDGQPRAGNEIVANEVKFLDRPGEASAGAEGRAEYSAAGGGGGVDADDLPF